MNTTHIYQKSIFVAASIFTLSSTTIPALAVRSNDSVEALSSNTNPSLHLVKTEKDSSQIERVGNKGACKVNPKLPSC